MKIMDNTSDEEVDKSKKSKKRKKAKRYTSDEEFEEFIDERKIKAKTKGDNIVNVRNKTEVEDDLDGKAKVKRKSRVRNIKYVVVTSKNQPHRMKRMMTASSSRRLSMMKNKMMVQMRIKS